MWSSCRQGNGKLRHVKVGIFWLQELADEQKVMMNKVAGKAPPTDTLTKHMHENTIFDLCEKVGQVRRQGRAERNWSWFLPNIFHSF